MLHGKCITDIPSDSVVYMVVFLRLRESFRRVEEFVLSDRSDYSIKTAKIKEM